MAPLHSNMVTTVTAPAGGCAAGDFVKVGASFGVAQSTAAAGAPVELLRVGAFTLPKATGIAWTKGDRLYWDTAAKNFTKTVTTNDLQLGTADADALSGDTTGAVNIDGVDPQAFPTQAALANAVLGASGDYIADVTPFLNAFNNLLARLRAANIISS